MTEVRWGIIGCGDVTERKSGPALSRIPGSRLVAVMRRDGAKAADYARRHGVPRSYEDAEKLIHDPEVNAVYVATPPDTHMEYALRVAAAGKPCYVEKPMARNGAEARRMTQAFADAGLPLFVAYYRRALPRFRRVQDLLVEGKLGRVTEIRYRQSGPRHLPGGPADGWRIDPQISGGGLFVDLASHTLDVLDFLFGPLTYRHGEARNVTGASQVDEVVHLHFLTPGGAQGSGTWNFACTRNEDRLVLEGTEGAVSGSIFGPEPFTWEPRDQPAELLDAPPCDPIQQPLLTEVVGALLHGTLCSSTGVSAMRTNELIDRVYANSPGLAHRFESA